MSNPSEPSCTGTGDTTVVSNRRGVPNADGSETGVPHGIDGLSWEGLDATAQITVRRDGVELKSGEVSLQSEAACEGSEIRRGSLSFD